MDDEDTFQSCFKRTAFKSVSKDVHQFLKKETVSAVILKKSKEMTIDARNIISNVPNFISVLRKN